MKKLLTLSSFLIISQAWATGFYRYDADLEELGASVASRLRGDRPTFAKGYVTGVADATFSVSWCPKSEVTEEYIFQTVNQYIQANPDRLNQRAATVVTDALAAVFPCHKR